jgi:predicted nuclease of predicted toxin-antitoxin system
MKIFVDENIPAMTLRELRRLGHEVKDIRNTENKGMADEDIWEMTQRDERLLITTDKGFVQKRNERHNGILVIRLKQPNRLKIHKKVIKAISLFEEKEWAGLTVVMQDAFHSVWRAKLKR